MTTPLMGWFKIGSLVDAYELKVVLVNTTARKKDKISTLLTKIKTIEIRSQNDLISITDILFKLYVRVV
jgi:hypothetical protein